MDEKKMEKEMRSLSTDGCEPRWKDNEKMELNEGKGETTDGLRMGLSSGWGRRGIAC